MAQAKTLTDKEIKRVLAIIQMGSYPERNKVAFLLSLYGALRVNEIAKLTVGDIYTHDGVVKGHVDFDASKMKQKRPHTIFLNQKMVKELERYRAHVSVDTSAAPLICSQKGGAFSPNTLCQLFTRIYRDAGLDYCTSHSGRRTAITKLANSGVSVRVIQSIAGHANLSTTQRYIDVNDELIKSAVELL